MMNKYKKPVLDEKIKLWMNSGSDLPTKIVSEDTLNSDYGSKSLLIDSRTGSVSNYDPLTNQHRRNFTQLDELAAISSAYEPNIRIVYKPQTKIRDTRNEN